MQCGFYKPTKKLGYTSYDIMLISSILIISIIYCVLVSIYPEKIRLNVVIGIILGIMMVIFIQDTIFREHIVNNYILGIGLIISLTFIITNFINLMLNNGENKSQGWIYFNYAMVPLSNTLFFWVIYTFGHLYNSINILDSSENSSLSSDT